MAEQNGKLNGESQDGRLALFGKRRLTPAERAQLEREDRIKDLLPDEDADRLGKVYDSRLVKRLFHYILVYKNKLIASIIFMSIASILSVAGPWMIGRAIDDGIRAGNVTVLYFWIALFGLFALFEWLTNRLRIVLMAYVGTKVVADLRSELFRHLHRLSLTFHNSYSVGRLMSRLLSDVGVLQDFVTWAITGMARSFFVLSGIAIAMLALNWRLALITFAVLPLVVILANYWRLRVREAYRATRRRLSLINGYLNESISGIRVTKSFTREEKNAQHFDDLNHSYFDANIAAAYLTATFLPGIDFLGWLALALVVGVGGWLVLQDLLTAGVLVAFVLYIERFFDPIRELAQRYNTFQAAMAGCERLFGLLDVVPDLKDPPDRRRLPPIVGRVEFDRVSFSYKEDEPVLRDLSLTAEPGERVALVGETGAGKSTVIRLLARFFDITGGSLRIDGYDLREVTQGSLRSQLGIVLQDTFLFGGTVADNIRYGQLEATDEAIVAAAKAVGVDDFVSKLPKGYQTEVGENGVSLSVGQRQLISFARALLANPRLLILDEATSSIDTATEKIIQRALDLLMEDRTTFVIAHRLSTIVNADKIVVLDHGRIVEMGRHEELLAQGGRYYNFYTMQWAQAEKAVDLRYT